VPSTPMVTSTRYFRPGLTKVTFASAISNIASPTRGEINAGTELSAEISDSSGWQVSSNFLDLPDLGSTFTAKLAARTSADDSSLTFYASSNSIDVRALLPRTTTGFIIWFDEGDVAGRKMDVFPVTVGSAPKDRSLEDPARIIINFAVTRVPSENVTVPA
jgi:hypothetical protein